MDMDFDKIRNYIFLGALGFVSILFFSLFRAFAYPIFWAAVIAAIAYPLYQKLNAFFKHPNLASLVTLSIVTIIILIPLTTIGTLLIKESINLYGVVNNPESPISTTIQKSIDFFKNSSFSQTLKINQPFLNEKISEFAKNGLSAVFTSLTDLTQNSVTFVIMFILMLYTLFYFLRDGENILKKLMHIFPLGDKYEMLLYKKFTSTASATIKGTLLIGGIQGGLGAIAFTVAGIQGALIWGIIMAFFSIIPGVGSSIVWLPTAIILLLTGQIWQGIMIIIVGVLIISTIDNLIRPILVGKDIQMHPALILFSTLGGIAVFGISGFVIGPIIASLFLAFWEIYEAYYRRELTNN
jgi:predicted PurR-regulated permease PerM